MVFCPKCGEELPEDANFCHVCGERTSKGIEEGVRAPKLGWDWERDLEEGISAAAKSVEEGLKAAMENIRYGYRDYGRYRVEDRRSFSGSISTPRVFFGVDNKNGPIRVSTWEKPEYNLDLLVKATGWTEEEAEENLKELRIDLEEEVVQDQTRLFLRIDYPMEDSRGYSIEVDVTLPSESKIELDVNSKNGRISLSKIEGETLKMRTSNGMINLDDVKAERIEGKTSNGRIEGKVESRDTSLRTSNGKIYLDLPCIESGDYRLRTSNGAVELTVSNAPHVGYDLDLHTSMGKVRVDIPDLDYGRYRRNIVRAKTRGLEKKDVKVIIEAGTSNGRIRVYS